MQPLISGWELKNLRHIILHARSSMEGVEGAMVTKNCPTISFLRFFLQLLANFSSNSMDMSLLDDQNFAFFSIFCQFKTFNMEYFQLDPLPGFWLAMQARTQPKSWGWHIYIFFDIFWMSCRNTCRKC